MLLRLVEELFGNGRRRAAGSRSSSGRRHPEPAALRFEIKATLAEAYAGKEWSVQYERDTPCTSAEGGCDGRGVSGPVEEAVVVCGRCGGQGVLESTRRGFFGLERVCHRRNHRCAGDVLRMYTHEQIR